MKHLLAKTLTSTALVLVTLTSAQAQRVRPDYLPYAQPLSGTPSPAQLQYFQEREAIIAKEVGEGAKSRTRTRRPDYLPYALPLTGTPSPAQLQYFEQREAIIAKELSSGTTSQESAMQWLQRQPNTP